MVVGGGRNASVEYWNGGVCVPADVVYLCISKVSIYVSSPQGLVRYPGLFDINYHFKFDR